MIEMDFFSNIETNHEFFQRIIQSSLFKDTVYVLVALGIAFLTGLVCRRLILRMRRMAEKTKFGWDDRLFKLLFDVKIDRSVVSLVFVSVFYAVLKQMERNLELLEKAVLVLLVFFFLRLLIRLMGLLNRIYETQPIAKKRPLRGVLQLTNIIFSAVAFVLVISVLLDRSPLVLLSGLGALSAVLILVFRDTIVNFTSGLQIFMNDLIEVGDWITLPEFEADGEVIEISLYFVKVQNWDKTISMIQMSRLINSNILNWRGMYDEKARRFKRAIYLSAEKVRFADEALLEKLAKIDPPPGLEEDLKQELEDFANGSAKERATNLGWFRKYASAYLRSLDTVNSELTLLVRQLEPTPNGIPLEFYGFANTTEWGEFEDIQSRILEHFFVACRYFDLEMFQSPSGTDLERLKPAKSIQ